MNKKAFEKQISELPKEVVFCKQCVMSNQRPRIVFSEEGICSACTNTKEYKNNIDWDSRELELQELLDKHRSSDGSWDVIVPSSGGKDSAFVAHQLKYKYGMNPLTVTWAPLKYTQIGFENYQALCDSGIANIMYYPNGKIHQKLARLCFEELGDAFHIFVLGQVAFPFHMAIKHNISLVMYGENGEAEYAGSPEIVDRPFVPYENWTKSYFKGSNIAELIEYGIKNKDYMSEEDFAHEDLSFYSPPSLLEMEKLNIQGKHFFGYYKRWSPQESYYYATENTGFKANKIRSEGTYTKYASIDDKFDGFHYFMKYVKFGFGRTTDDTSHEIRERHLSREEAVALVKKFDGEFPEKYFREFLEYLGITESYFWEVVDSWRLEHIWDKDCNGKWKLKKTVF